MVELDPAFKSQNGDEVLRSIEEWMVQQARAAKTTNQTADKDNCGPGKGTPFSPGIAPPEPSIEPQAVARRIVRLSQANRPKIQRARATN